MEEQTEQKHNGLETPEQINKRWTHRRRMAYIALISNICLMIFILVFPARVKEIASIINTFIGSMFAIVAAYNGFALTDDIMLRGKYRSSSSTRRNRY
jgi:uncharacterized membrane protein